MCLINDQKITILHKYDWEQVLHNIDKAIPGLN